MKFECFCVALAPQKHSKFIYPPLPERLAVSEKQTINRGAGSGVRGKTLFVIGTVKAFRNLID